MKKIKYLLKLKFWIVLSVLLLAGNGNAQTDTISFLHITDTHIIFNLDFYHPGIEEGRRHYSQGIEPLKQFLQTMPEKTNSDFIALTGDMIDFFEAQTDDGEMLDFQIEQFSRLIDDCMVPVFMTLGNHDIAAYSWPDNRRVSSQLPAERTRAAWIRNISTFKEGTYFSNVINVGATNYRLIFIDNAYNSFSPEENIKAPYIDKPQSHWLEDQIGQSEDDTEIIFMHLPVSSPNDSGEPANEIYSVLSKYPSIKIVLAGHNHINIIRDFSSTGNNRITQVQTDAFGRNPDNWRLIRLTENKILVSFAGKTDTEIEIGLY